MDFNKVQSHPSSWPRVRIGDVAEVFDGPHATPNKTSTGPVFLGISALNRGRLDLSNTEHLSEDEFVRWTRRVTPQAGDVVFSYETRIGEAAIIPHGLRCCLGRRMGLVRTDPSKLDPYFFLYQYLSPTFQDFLTSRTIHGSTVDRIALKEFPNFEIELPPIGVQRQVAKVMLDIDAKIDLNSQINQTVEAMVQALFKSWFVDFDPVKAKIAAIQQSRDPLRAAMGAISGKTDAELDALPQEQFDQLATTAAHFPDEMEQSELGAIPRGWKASRVGEITSRVAMGPFGSDIKKENFVEVGVPVIRGGNLTNGLIEHNYVFVSESKADELRNANAFPGDIVITHRGTLGQVGLIPKGSKFPRYVVSQSQMLLSVDRQRMNARYVFEFLRSDMGKNLLLANTSQVGVPAIARPTGSVKALPLIVPAKTVLDSYEETLQPLLDNLTLLNMSSEELSELRDILLPKILSGELAVNAPT